MKKIFFSAATTTTTTTTTTTPPTFFEADYLELVKDLPEISLGPSSGYEKYSKLSVYGPDAFPILTDNDGYAYVAAGRFGNVSNSYQNISINYPIKVFTFLMYINNIMTL